MKKLMILVLALFTVTASTSQVVKLEHVAYTIYFDTQLKQPLCTYYVLEPTELGGDFNRTTFKADPLILSTMQGQDADYYLSGFDRGHLSPNDDFRFDLTVQLESMYYTNCVPQNSTLNRGTWKSLENYVRVLAIFSPVQVWTGVTYGNSTSTIGKLVVPVYFWKLIKVNGNYEAYHIPNSSPLSKNFSDYKIPVEELLLTMMEWRK